MNTKSSFCPIIDKTKQKYILHIYYNTIMTVFLKHVSWKKVKMEALT